MKFCISEDSDTLPEAAIKLPRQLRRIMRSKDCEILIVSLEFIGRQPDEIMRYLSLLRKTNVSIRIGLEDSTELKLEHAIPVLLQTLSAIERKNTSRRTIQELQSAKSVGKASGRPLVMTPQRQVTAVRMLTQGKRGMQILPVIRALAGPSISQSAYYLWQKAWMAEGKV